MAVDPSALKQTIHPQIQKLQERLADLFPNRAGSAMAEGGNVLGSLAQHLPALMPVITAVFERVRGRRDGDPTRATEPDRTRHGFQVSLKWPVIIAVAVAGTAYLIGRFAHRSKTVRSLERPNRASR